MLSTALPTTLRDIILSEEVWNDRCDFYNKVDDSKREVDPCTKMTARCKGETCATGNACKDFVLGLEVTNTLALAGRRTTPKVTLAKR